VNDICLYAHEEAAAKEHGSPQQQMRPTLPYGGIGTAWVDDDV